MRRTRQLVCGWCKDLLWVAADLRERRPGLLLGLIAGFMALFVFALVAAVAISDGASNRQGESLSPERSVTEADKSEPPVRYVAYNGLAHQQSQEADSAEAYAAGSERPGVALRTLSELLRDRLDDSELIYGSNGSEGSILPLDNGVVPSSGPRFQTQWQLILPSAGIRAAVVQVGLTPDGAMGSPDNPFVVGWFNRSALPGETGNALLGGHRDYQDRDGNIDVGVCWKLDETRVGDQLIMFDESQNRYYIYDIVDKATIRPDSKEAIRYLSQTRESVVTLITCSGDFDEQTHSYEERIVVVALLSAVARPDA
ncbi:MAG: class F sortase [Chloroflexota bacterium]|nr:class F sortase [Chloroflexota bacterium]